MSHEPINEILDQQPPSDKEAERAVLGSILIDTSKRDAVAQIIPQADAFYVGAHRVIYRHMLDMSVVDEILLLARLRVTGDLDAVGGQAYLCEILQAVAVPNHAEHYARVVAELSRKRELIYLNTRALIAIYSGKWTAAELAGRQIERLRDIHERANGGSDSHGAGEGPGGHQEA